MVQSKRGLGLLAVGLVALALPASASGAVTIGSNLAAPAVDGGLSCSGDPPTPCTVVNLQLPPSSTAPDGLVSPIDGVVVRWRIKTGETVTPVAARITRPGNGATQTGAGTGPTENPPANTISTFELQLPIKAGDAVGMDCCLDELTAIFASTEDAAASIWNPPLVDGEAPRLIGLSGGIEFLINADIEPDCDKDGLGDETQDSTPGCPRTLTLIANKKKVEEGKRVTLSGELTQLARQTECQSAQTVELQRKKPSQTEFKTVEQVQTDAEGAFSAKEKVKKTFQYQAEVPQTPTCAGQTSNVEKVKVKKPK